MSVRIYEWDRKILLSPPSPSQHEEKEGDRNSYLDCIYTTVGYIPQKMMLKYLKKQRFWSIPVLLYEVKWEWSFGLHFLTYCFIFLKKYTKTPENHLTEMNVLANLRIMKYYCFWNIYLDIYWQSKLSLDQVKFLLIPTSSCVPRFLHTDHHGFEFGEFFQSLDSKVINKKQLILKTKEITENSVCVCGRGRG